MQKLKSPLIAVDAIILEKGKILLVKRAHYPFIGYWVLPGGGVEYGERVEEAVLRELKEELNISVRIKKLIGVYSDPKRDPRVHVASVAFLCQRIKGRIKLDFEASEFKYFPLNSLPQKIGFDHREMIEDFKKSL